MAKFTIAFICILLGFKSRQAFYKAEKKEEKKKKEDQIVLDLVKNLRHEMPRTGTNKLYPDLVPLLKKEGIKMGRDKVHQVLKEHDQIIKNRKKYKVTTDSKHHFWKHKNLVKNLLINDLINRPEQVFVADITYIKVKEQYAYLFLITDAYSKKIMGCSINYTMKVKDAKKAVLMAHKNRLYKGDVIHHSDRGIQYCTPSFIKYIQSKNMIPSMTEKDHVYENSIAERVNGILKIEFGIDQGFKSLKEARKVIQQSILLYNNKRRHYSLNLDTPNSVHYKPGIKMKSWRTKKKFNKNNTN